MTDEEAMDARAAELKRPKTGPNFVPPPPINIPADDGLSLPPRPPVDIPPAWGYGQVAAPRVPGRREKKGFFGGSTYEYCQDCITNAGTTERLENELAAAKRIAAEALASAQSAKEMLRVSKEEVKAKDFQIGELFQQLREASK